MTSVSGTDEIAFPRPARMDSKSFCVSTPFASMLSMAVTCALAASCSAAPSIFEPITIILSTACMTCWADFPGTGFW